MAWLYPTITLLSVLAAVLAWAAKLMWAKEYKEAKEAQIELLKEQIKSLEELTPMKVREFYISTKQQLEEYIEKLQGDLKTKTLELERLAKSGEDRAAEIEQLTIEKGELENKIYDLEKTVNDEWFNELMRHSFFGFDLKVKGSVDAVNMFIKRSDELGKSRGQSYRPVNDHFVVNLTYSETVLTDEIKNLADECGLKILEIKGVRGLSF